MAARTVAQAAAAGAFLAWLSLRLPGLWSSAGASAGPGPASPAVRPRHHRAQRAADAVRREPEVLPPDPHRDYFYNTRYADNGRVKHPNWVCTQGLYGLGWKTPDTKSVYPYFYGMPGQSTVDSSSRPWWRPLRFFQGLAHPFRPVGMYYQLGSYVPIYDLDPIAPGLAPIRTRSTSTGCTAAKCDLA